ncbi:helix-turn-helix transcriptional regulator [Amycolatopsis sp. NPDC051106]|uniref:helix-turn-helix domain-containing protein n=1 Tax=unclassified Amycolatopsis TaxID=2618356 RepID=UPI00342A2550
MPPQNISNWESGKRVPKIEELATILGALRVAPDEHARLLNLARFADDPDWLNQAILDGSTWRREALIEGQSSPCRRSATPEPAHRHTLRYHPKR